MSVFLEVVIAAMSVATCVLVAWAFIWAAKKDGDEDRIVQKRLGIRRRTRLGRYPPKRHRDVAQGSFRNPGPGEGRGTIPLREEAAKTRARLVLRDFPDATAVDHGDAPVMPLLVVYASRHGATAEIAARIAARLVDSGASVDLRLVEEIETLDAYDAVVLGAPVYDQSWPSEADAFIARNRAALAARPLWLFSVGSFGDTKHLIGPLTHKEPKGIEAIRAELRPREYRVFQGVIQKHQWPFWSRVFFHAFGGRFGDHRDWPTIDAWADRIAVALPSLRSMSQV